LLPIKHQTGWQLEVRSDADAAIAASGCHRIRDAKVSEYPPLVAPLPALGWAPVLCCLRHFHTPSVV